MKKILPEPAPAIGHILRLPGSEGSLSVQRWMQLCLSRLTRPRCHPAVLRYTRTRTEESRLQERVEVRRRTQQVYSAVPGPLGPEKAHLFLDANATLVACSVEHRRILRQTPTLVVYDEVFRYEAIAAPEIHHLLCLQQACVERCQDELYLSWASLEPAQKLHLLSYPASWAQVRPALDGLGQVDSLPLLLSEQAHPELRLAVLEAGERGDLRPVPEVLPLLLAQPQWNQSPALVVMARSAAECPHEHLLALQSHPNPLVRARLVELMPTEHDWIGWLASESDGGVREAIRRSVERRLNPHELVDGLIGPPHFPGFRARKQPDARRAEALGWLLVGWSRKLEHSQDWKALNRALTSPIGAENRQKLKQKLSASGRLSLTASLLP